MIYVLIGVVLFLLYQQRSVSTPKATAGLEIYDEYKDAIDLASARFGIPKTRIVAIIGVESGGDPHAVGTSGETGLMQLTQGALDDVNNTYGTYYTKLLVQDGVTNIQAGVRYLAWLKSNLNNNLDLATEAFNAGIGTIQNGGTDKSYLDKIYAYEDSFTIT